jgi:hypothetical protein
MTEADPSFTSRLSTGRSSGEGLIWTLRDPTGHDPGAPEQATPGHRARVRVSTQGIIPRDLHALTDAAHERNATLNYRSVLARELTAEDAPMYLQTRQQRRSRRPTTDGGATQSV